MEARIPLTWLISGPQLGVLAFVCMFGAAVAAMLVSASAAAPGPLRAAADLIGRGTTVVAVMAALLLAMMTSSLKTSFDSADQNARRFAAQLTQIDRTLRHAGPAAGPARETLFRYTTVAMKEIWPKTQARLRADDSTSARMLQILQDQIEGLTDGGPFLQADARQSLHDAQATLLELQSRRGGSMSPWLLGFLIFWLSLTFAGFGMAAPQTPLAITALFMFAVALSGALFLASEYDYPFDGVIVISTEPVEAALFAMTSE